MGLLGDDGQPTVSRLLGRMRHSAFQGRKLGEAFEVWQRMIDGNDGGVDLSWDGGESWYTPPLPLGQFYHVTADRSVPYQVSGAMQDLGTASCPSNSLSSGGIANADCHDVGGGEAGFTAHDPSDPNVVWAGEYFGIITRYDHRTGMARNVTAYPENWSGHGAEDDRFRFQWTAPIHISPHDPKVVYHAANVLFRTEDGGQSWKAISPDLTRNDKSKQKWSGGPITGDNTGVEWYDTIFAVAESPKEKGLIWAGSDDGLVHVTRDGGGHWTDLTPNLKGIPEWGTVGCIEPSPHDAATAYVTVDAHRLDDSHPYLWKTGDYGKTWKSLAAKLPQDVYLHAVREDPKRRGLLFIATERGVMFSRDDGGSWQVLGLNLPTVAVHDLVVKDDDLILGTHGRSIWILDDLTPIRDWTKEIAGRPAHLFAPRPAIRWEHRSSFHEDGAGENPPQGAVIAYALREKTDGAITLEILDPAGTVVRTLSSKKEPSEVEDDDPDAPYHPAKKAVLTTEAGVQRVAWDLGYESATKIKKAKTEGDPEAAPRVVPGTYTVRLTVGGKALTAPLEVRPDPRLSVPQADIEAQVGFARQAQAQVTRLAGLVAQIRSVRDQVKIRSEALGGSARASGWTKAAQDLVAKCDALEEKLHQPKAQVEYDILAKGARLYARLSPLLGYAADGTGAPTKGMREVFSDQVRELDGLEAEWKAIVSGDLADLGRKGRELDLQEVVVPETAATSTAR